MSVRTRGAGDIWNIFSPGKDEAGQTISRMPGFTRLRYSGAPPHVARGGQLSLLKLLRLPFCPTGSAVSEGSPKDCGTLAQGIGE